MGGRIYPKQDLGLIQFGANPAGDEIAATAADAERAELTKFLVEHGAFVSVASRLVEWMLVHKTVGEAKGYALAHVRVVSRTQRPIDPRDVQRIITEAERAAGLKFRITQ